LNIHKEDGFGSREFKIKGLCVILKNKNMKNGWKIKKNTELQKKFNESDVRKKRHWNIM
jgi:flagellar biosynthesis/type III secretory pathway chaperone